MMVKKGRRLTPSSSSILQNNLHCYSFPFGRSTNDGLFLPPRRKASSRGNKHKLHRKSPFPSQYYREIRSLIAPCISLRRVLLLTMPLCQFLPGFNDFSLSFVFVKVPFHNAIVALIRFFVKCFSEKNKKFFNPFSREKFYNEEKNPL